MAWISVEEEHDENMMRIWWEYWGVKSQSTGDMNIDMNIDLGMNIDMNLDINIDIGMNIDMNLDIDIDIGMNIDSDMHIEVNKTWLLTKIIWMVSKKKKQQQKNL